MLNYKWLFVIIQTYPKTRAMWLIEGAVRKSSGFWIMNTRANWTQTTLGTSKMQTKWRQLAWVEILHSSVCLCATPCLWLSIFSVPLFLREGTKHLLAGKTCWWTKASLHCTVSILPVSYELIHVTEVCIWHNTRHFYTGVALVHFFGRSSTPNLYINVFVFLSFWKTNEISKL